MLLIHSECCQWHCDRSTVTMTGIYLCEMAPNLANMAALRAAVHSHKAILWLEVVSMSICFIPAKWMHSPWAQAAWLVTSAQNVAGQLVEQDSMEPLHISQTGRCDQQNHRSMHRGCTHMICGANLHQWLILLGHIPPLATLPCWPCR